jgi:hypothetical protein
LKLRGFSHLGGVRKWKPGQVAPELPIAEYPNRSSHPHNSQAHILN